MLNSFGCPLVIDTRCFLSMAKQCTSRRRVLQLAGVLLPFTLCHVCQAGCISAVVVHMYLCTAVPSSSRADVPRSVANFCIVAYGLIAGNYKARNPHTAVTVTRCMWDIRWLVDLCTVNKTNLALSAKSLLCRVQLQFHNRCSFQC